MPVWATSDSEHSLAPPLSATTWAEHRARTVRGQGSRASGARSAGRRLDLDGAAARATIMPTSWQRSQCSCSGQRIPDSKR